MPSTVGGHAGARLKKIAGELDRANRIALNQAALAAKTIQLAELDRVTKGRKLRNVGKSGAKVGVRYDVKGTKNPTALLRATGPWHLIENTSKPHEIRPRARGRSMKKALATPFGPRATAQHPGVRNPLQPWKHGEKTAKAAAMKVLDRTYVDAFRRGAR